MYIGGIMQSNFRIARRKLSLLGGLGFILNLHLLAFHRSAISQGRSPKEPPVWTSFGLNGGADEQRFDLTRKFVNRPLTDPSAFEFMRPKLTKYLQKHSPPTVQFKDQIIFGQNKIIGFAHDYEVALGLRLDRLAAGANQLIVFMSGVGLIMDFIPDGNSGYWKIISSFPFMLRYQTQGGDLTNIQGKAIEKMDDVYEGYAQAFSFFAQRFNKWDKDHVSKVSFAQLKKVDMHRDASSLFKKIKIDGFFNEKFIGISTSTFLCDKLDIPLLPFVATDSAFRWGAVYKDSIKTSSTLKIPDADLTFDIVIRHADKKLTPSSQYGLTIIKRTLVINFKAYFDLGAGPGQIFQTLALVDNEDRIPYGANEEDDTPERDIIFFDRLLSKLLSNLLTGIMNKDTKLLTEISVNLDKIGPQIPLFLQRCSSVR